MNRRYRCVFMEKCLAVVWFILIFSSVENVEYINVTRGLSDGGSIKKEDIFTLPSSLCNANPKCSKFGGNIRSAQKCICECPQSKSTFSVYSGQLKCTKNALVRNPAGCTFKFYRTKEVTDPNAALEVVSGHYFRYLNPLKENTKWACQIVPSTSAYQDCTGNWLASANGWARFEISVETGTGYFSFKLKSDPSNSYAYFNGKIVKLSVRCTGGQGQVEDSCLLFKVKGPLNCNTNLPTATVVTTTTTSSQITTTVKPSTVRPVDEKTTSSPTRPVDGITTASSQTTQKKEISQSPSTFAPMDNSSVVIEGSLRPTSLRSTVEDKGQGGGVVTVESPITGEGEQISKAGSGSNLVYIAIGAVLSAAVIILSVLLVVMCRRNSNTSLDACWKSSTKNHNKDNRTQTNLQLAPVYDDANYMMPVEPSDANPPLGRRKGFANPTYERGKDNTVKFRNYGNGIAGSHDGQRESSNIYTDSDLLSPPLPPIPGPSGSTQPERVDVFDVVANQSDDDQMYQSVDKFGPRENMTPNLNFSAPMYCAPYHSSDVCRGTSSNNNNTPERTAHSNHSRSIQGSSGPQEAMYQALNSPPSSPTSPKGPGSSEYQPLVKVPPQVEQDSFA